MSVNLMFFVLLLVVCALAGWIAIPRIMRSWTVATKPTDERLEYVSHMGKEMDCGPSEVAPRSTSAPLIEILREPRSVSCEPAVNIPARAWRGATVTT